MAAVQAAGPAGPGGPGVRAGLQAAQAAPQVAPAVHQTHEIRLNPPTVFNEDRLKFKHFHQAVLLYLC